MNDFVMRSSCVLLALLVCTAHPRADEQSARPHIGNAVSNTNQPAMQASYSRLSIDSTIGDVIAHPAFAGFGSLILPWDDRNPDVNMHMRDISTLLPYHTDVNQVDVVTALNRMIDHAN